MDNLMKNSRRIQQSNKMGQLLHQSLKDERKINPERVRTTDLIVHYKQIQYEFCSKGHTFILSSNKMRQGDTFVHEP